MHNEHCFLSPSPSKGNPGDIITKNQSRGSEQLSKFIDVNTFIFVLLELDPGMSQHINGVLGIHILTTHNKERKLYAMLYVLDIFIMVFITYVAQLFSQKPSNTCT